MINGLEGIPGSGKSYEACVFQVLAAVSEGRKVITNLPLIVDAYAAIDPSYRALIEIRYVPAPVRGTWSPDRVDPETGQGSAFTLFEDGHTERAPEGSRVFGTVWDYYSEWKHPQTGRGPLFVVDECHVAMPKIGTSKDVIEYYKLHRHFNADVLLATQKFRDMCQDIAGIMAMVIKVRKADILGKPDEYIRKVHAGYRGAVIQESLRKYEPHYFTLYRSHTQGNSVLEAGATDVAPLAVKVKRWTRLSWLLFGVLALYAIWSFTKPKVPKGNPTGSAVVKADGKTDFGALNAMLDPPRRVDAPGAEKAPEGPLQPSKDADPEPYVGKTLHLVGRMRMGAKEVAMFVVSNGAARITDVSSVELAKVGYRWEPMTDCAGYLRWGNVVRAITCDAPRAGSGSNEKPLVMNGGYGSMVACLLAVRLLPLLRLR